MNIHKSINDYVATLSGTQITGWMTGGGCDYWVRPHTAALIVWSLGCDTDCAEQPDDINAPACVYASTGELDEDSELHFGYDIPYEIFSGTAKECLDWMHSQPELEAAPDPEQAAKQLAVDAFGDRIGRLHGQLDTLIQEMGDLCPPSDSRRAARDWLWKAQSALSFARTHAEMLQPRED